MVVGRKGWAGLVVALGVVVLAIACQSEPTGVSQHGGPLASLCSPGAGQVVAVFNRPQRDSTFVIGGDASDTVSSEVWRDDPSIPGDQLLCTDPNVVVTYTQYGAGTSVNCLTPGQGSVWFDVVSTQRVIYHRGQTGTHVGIIGTANGNKADTTCVYQQFQP